MADLRRASKSSTARPRRRDIVVTAALGVAVLAVLGLSGELAGAAFAASALAVCALAAVYYLTALSAIEPAPRPSAAAAHRDAD
ncbi:MAG: hypothetical protein ACFE0P_05375, partial [Oceanicaulis sp.]